MPALKAVPAAACLASARKAAHRRIENASLDLPHPGLADATARFVQHPDPVFQMALAREIAQTRRHELTLAYRNVLTVAAGYRLKRPPAGGAAQRLPEPCVVLVVRSKWRPGARPADVRQRLPSHLLIGAEYEGERRLFAVPTDVQQVQPFTNGRAHAAHAVVVDDPALPAFGTVACAVRVTPLDGGLPRVLALSAMHVFTPFAEVHAAPRAAPAAVLPEPHPLWPAVGNTTLLRGRLLKDDYSFDAQLAEVDLDWLRRQLADMPLSAQVPYVSSPQMLDGLHAAGAQFSVRAADNHRHHGRVQIMLGTPTTETSALPLDYELRASPLGAQADPLAPLEAVPIFHWELLQFDVLGPDDPQPGDSGSPVLALPHDGRLTLVGLYLGGSESRRTARVLPAWQLFDPANWNRDGPLLTGIEPVNL